MLVGLRLTVVLKLPILEYEEGLALHFIALASSDPFAAWWLYTGRSKPRLPIGYGGLNMDERSRFDARK